MIASFAPMYRYPGVCEGVLVSDLDFKKRYKKWTKQFLKVKISLMWSIRGDDREQQQMV